jgi:L-fuculose-phosphate aldolase
MKRDGTSAGESPTDAARLAALVEAAHEARREDLVVSTSGNFSVRLPGGRFAISAARTKLGSLQLEDLVILPLEGKPSEPPPRRPSRETPLHQAVYAACPWVESVLHFQSLAGTILACREGPLPDLSFLPEVPVYLRRIGEVPYFPPGSEELAGAVAALLSEPEVRLAQLRNHGQVVVASSPEQAVERAIFFELAARVVVFGGGAHPPRRFSERERGLLESY